MAKPPTSRWNPHLAALLALAAGLGALWLVDRVIQSRFRQDARSDALDRINGARARLEGIINARLSLLRGVASYVSLHPGLGQEEFERFAAGLASPDDGVRGISLAKGSVRAMVYPLDGNEDLIGANLADYPEQWRSVEAALESRAPVFDGPIRPPEGGLDFIGRQPIYLPAQSEAGVPGAYWGIASLRIGADYLYEAAGLSAPLAAFRYALGKVDGATPQGDTFFGDPGLAQPAAQAVSVDVVFPGGAWRLSAAPADGWQEVAPGAWGWRAGGLLMSLLLAMLAWILIWTPARMREAVDEATSALRMAEARYRGVFENAQEGIFLTSPEGTYLDANPALARMYGYPSPEALIHAVRNIALQVYVDPGKRLEFARLLDQSDRIAGFEAEVRRLDGAKIWIRENARAIRDAEGRLLCYEGSIVDVTDLRRAERDKAELQARLMQSQKMEAIGTLAGGVAHDFNNLLTGILGYASMLRVDSEPGTSAATAAEVIEKAAERAAHLTKQLLGFARRGKLQNLPVDIHAIIQEVASLLGRTLEKSISIKLRLEAKNPFILGDPDQIQQVILNLAVNARDSMPDGGELSLSTYDAEIGADEAATSPDAEPGRHLAIAVRDTGQGIPPEIAGRIFEPFFTTKEKGKGTGMGLAMVYGIIQNHGGFIRVQSEPGKGATFRVFLPAAQERPAPPPSRAPSPIRGAGKILVVDDEPVVRDLARDLLAALGYSVTLASSGQEAVDLLGADPGSIDLALLDMAMPGMGGRECFRALRAIRPDIKVIVSTGYAPDGAVEDMFERGLAGFLQKPYRLVQLSEAVSKALTQSPPPPA